MIPPNLQHLLAAILLPFLDHHLGQRMLHIIHFAHRLISERGFAWDGVG